MLRTSRKPLANLAQQTRRKDLQTNQDLVDKALEELEELKPMCIDTGMSYKERVEKREEETEQNS